MCTADDYGGRDRNDRLEHPDRAPDWARMSPAPFTNRRVPRRNWAYDFSEWTPVAAPATTTNQDSIAAAIEDALQLEVIRLRPPSSNLAAVRGLVKQGLAGTYSIARQKNLFAAGVKEPGIFDWLQALMRTEPLPVGNGRIAVDYIRLPLDLEYWRDWIARRGPIVALIHADQHFREHGRESPEAQVRSSRAATGAVLVSGYEYGFEGRTTTIKANSYFLRPGFPLGHGTEEVKVSGAFAEANFVEGFGLITSFVSPELPDGIPNHA
jgi:hypothetical protein